jgi:glycosyltransferase involved in cell wall biosynthesis
MRVGIDVRELAHPNTGIGSYVSNLVQALGEIDTQNQYFLFISKGDEPYVNELDLPHNFNPVPVPNYPIDKLQDQIGIVRAMRGLDLDIFHATHHDVTPLLTRVPMVVTVHDIAPMDFYNPSWLHRTYYSAFTYEALCQARWLICISKSTQRRISHHFPSVSQKTSVVYYGRDHRYRPLVDQRCFINLSSKLGILSPFILYVGSFARRKNIRNLMTAVRQIVDCRPDLQMVFVGGDSGFSDYHFGQDLPDQVVLVGKLERKNDLRILYGYAELLLFPSLYEGFGLPPLEAMACGCPVITSNVSALPEVVGDAGMKVDPTNPDDISNKTLQILRSDKLRQHLAQKGLARAQRFEWKKTAKETLNIYRRVVAINRNESGG